MGLVPLPTSAGSLPEPLFGSPGKRRQFSEGGSTFHIQDLVEETQTTFSSADKSFTLKELIGDGSFGTVFRCSCGGGESEEKEVSYAVKIIDSAKISIRLGHPIEAVLPRLRQEVDILARLGSHPQILKLEYAYYSPESHRFYLLTELLTGGELFHAITKRSKPYAEKEAKAIFQQIVQAVAFCHSMGVAHRDVKLENIIFVRPDSLELKLVDYGQAKVLGGTTSDSGGTSRTLTTTPIYTAPEVSAAVQVAKPYDAFKADSFGLGVILCGVLCSALPRVAEDASYEKHPQWQRLSEDARELIRALLHVDPKERPLPDQVLDHVWLAELSRPKSASESGFPEPRRVSNEAVECVLAVHRVILALQRERGTCCWALGAQEGEQAYHFQRKFSDERLEEVTKQIQIVLGQGSGGRADLAAAWESLLRVTRQVQHELSEIRVQLLQMCGCRGTFQQDDASVLGMEEYTPRIKMVMDQMDTIMMTLTGDMPPSPEFLRLKLLQLSHEQLGRERAFMLCHLTKPSTLRLAKNIRRLAEVIGARKVFLGSTTSTTHSNQSIGIVTSEVDLAASLRLSKGPILDSDELAKLEAAENRALMRKQLDAGFVSEWYLNLTKVIDQIHQHLAVSLADYLYAKPGFMNQP